MEFAQDEPHALGYGTGVPDTNRAIGGSCRPQSLVGDIGFRSCLDAAVLVGLRFRRPPADRSGFRPFSSVLLGEYWKALVSRSRNAVNGTQPGLLRGRFTVAVDFPSNPIRIANDAITGRPVRRLQRHEHRAALR